MLINYLKIGYRNLLRHKLFTSINVVSLALGMGISLMMLVHIKQELSYESGFPKHELIYRVASTKWAKMAPPLAGALKSEMPEIKETGRFYDLSPAILTYEDRQITSQQNFLADPSIIDIFDFEFITGNPTEALTHPNSIVLTENVAARLFQQNESPLGKPVKLNGNETYTISGVIQNLPENTHLKIDCLVSMSSSDLGDNEARAWSAMSTYALLDSEEAARQLTDRLRDFQYRFLNGIVTPEEIEREGDFYELDPIDEIHLNSHKEKEISANSDVSYIYIFTALSLLIILLACINFVNLFTAQSIQRIKEIGVRKAIGALRTQLIFQFLSEAYLMVMISTLLAALLAYASIPFYNKLGGLGISLQQLFATENLLLLMGIAAVTGLLAGAYPAFFVSKLGVVESLKATKLPTGSANWLRKSLVGFQFFISMVMLIGALAIYQQMHFIHEKDLGFDKEQVVAINLHSQLWVEATYHKETLKNELLQTPGVHQVATTSKLMGDRFGYEGLQLKGSENDPISARYVRADEGFLKTLNLQLLEGRDFAPSSDTTSTFIINKKAAELLHDGDLIGKLALNTANNNREAQIVGIVENFNYASLHQEIEPLVIEYQPQYSDYLLLNIDTRHIPQTMQAIEATIHRLAPNTLIVSTFLDDHLNISYQSENNLFRVFQVFSVLAIVVASLGLFALAAHTVQSRVKEIGIRKILGASVSNILLVLTKNYVRLVLIAFVVAIPIANYFITEWLSQFAYQTEISWWLFALPGVGVLLVALLAISGQTLKAATSNPVDSLKYE